MALRSRVKTFTLGLKIIMEVMRRIWYTITKVIVSYSVGMTTLPNHSTGIRLWIPQSPLTKEAANNHLLPPQPKTGRQPATGFLY